MRRLKGERGGFEGAACLPLCLSELRVFVRHEEALQVNAEVELAEELGRHNALGCEQQRSGRTEGRHCCGCAAHRLAALTVEQENDVLVLDGVDAHLDVGVVGREAVPRDARLAREVIGQLCGYQGPERMSGRSALLRY